MANRIPEDAWQPKESQLADAKHATVQALCVSSDPPDYLVMDLTLHEHGGQRVQVAICPRCFKALAIFIDEVKLDRPHIFEE